MHLLFAIFTFAVLLEPIQAEPPEEFKKIEYVERSEINLIKEKVVNMGNKIVELEKNEVSMQKKMSELELNEVSMQNKMFEMEKNEKSMKSNMFEMKIKMASVERKLKIEIEYLNDVEEMETDNKYKATFINKIENSEDQENKFHMNADELDDGFINRAGNSTEDRLKYLEELSKLNLRRSCQELAQYGINMNSYYYVDPDGPLVGNAPIRVYCEFTQNGMAITEVLHNSEEKIDVEHCHDPGCYVRPVVYSAPDFQIQSLIQLSETCEQSIEYNCLLAPLEKEGIDFGFWLDKNGDAQVYWDGANNGQHVCGCYFEEGGCLEQETTHAKCNCDAAVPEMKSDMGTIRNASALPIMQMQFGGLTYEVQQASHQLGRLRCWGKADFGDGTSCNAIKKAGEFRSGFYNVKKSEESNSQLVFCNSSAGYDENSNNEVFVESSEDHFLEVEVSIVEVEIEVTEVKTDMTEVKTDMTEVKTEITEIKTHTTEMDTDISGIKTNIIGIEMDLLGIETDITGIKTGMTEFDTDISEIQIDISGIKTDISDFGTDISEIGTDISVIKTDISGIKTNIDGIETAVIGIKTDVIGIKTDISGINTDISGINTDISEIITEISGFGTDINELKTDITSMKTDITEIKTDISGFETDTTGMKTDISEIKTDITGMKTDISGIFILESILQDKVAELEKRSDYCAYRESWNTFDSTITYEKLLLNNNHNIPGAQLDINTGKFKAGITGIYEVDIYFFVNNPSLGGLVFLHQNGIAIDDDEMTTATGSIMSSPTENELGYLIMGGRSLKLHLKTGDTLEVVTTNGLFFEEILGITFCVTLA